MDPSNYSLTIDLFTNSAIPSRLETTLLRDLSIRRDSSFRIVVVRVRECVERGECSLAFARSLTYYYRFSYLSSLVKDCWLLPIFGSSVNFSPKLSSSLAI